MNNKANATETNTDLPTTVAGEETGAPAAAPADVVPVAPAAPIVPSKMDKAKILFAGLRDGTITLEEGKSARATFIAQAQLPEIGMTKNGAATYWQNLVSAEKGGKLYPHTAAKKKTDEAKPADEKQADDVKVDEPAEEGEAKDPDDLSHLEG